MLLVGKTNVGKSSLFNRLTDKKISIAHHTPGATRDCVMRETTLGNNTVMLVDSGGLSLELATQSPFQTLVEDKVDEYIEKSDLVLFVVSAKDGVSKDDYEIAQKLTKSGKTVLLVINKVDDESHELKATDCLRFGFSDWLFVSAAQNRGLDDLSAKIISMLPKRNVQTLNLGNIIQLISAPKPETEKVKIAIIGRPNSGKSTYVNKLLNEERVITSDMPGTTVDAIDTELSFRGQSLILIDTAGIRRQRSISEEVEKMAVARSLCALDRSDVSVLMLNAQEGVTEQDQKIAGMIFEKKKALVIAINKWDEDVLDETSKDRFIEKVRFALPFLGFAPVVFISAKYGRDVFKPIESALDIGVRFKAQINTSRLNRSLERAQVGHPPPMVLGKRLKMFFATQIETAPPTFVISCSKPDGFHFSYQRYLTNFFREDLGLKDIPLRVFFRSKNAFLNNEKSNAQ